MQENSEENIPEWLQEYNRRYHEIYEQLVKTSESRNKQHKEALDALYRAVVIANQASLNFLEATKISSKKKDSSDEKQNNNT